MLVRAVVCVSGPSAKAFGFRQTISVNELLALVSPLPMVLCVLLIVSAIF